MKKNKDIKNYCVACWAPLKIDYKRYASIGNYCSSCSARASKETTGEISYEESRGILRERRQRYGMI